jgi:hypothetical protein
MVPIAVTPWNPDPWRGIGRRLAAAFWSLSRYLGERDFRLGDY